MNRRILLFINAMVAVSMLSCIDDGDRPEEKEPFVHPVDEGSRAYSCDQDADVTQFVFADFEFGSAPANWYANNEVCEDCQKLEEDLAELRAELNSDTETDIDTETETEAVTFDTEDDEDTATETEEALTPGEVSLINRLESCRIQCDASANPNYNTKPPWAEEISPEPRCDSKFAIHFTAQGLVDWGANLGASFGVAQDFSQFDGISFWARRANHSHGVMRIEVADQYTEPNAKNEDGEKTNTAVCTYDQTLDNPEDGCDRYGSFVQISTDWKFFKLPFEDMRQAGWGAQVPPLDTQTLYSVTFLFLPGTWDMWLDDVAFYTEGN
ncbi:MAG: hypothetical protein JXX29_18950 [Deltaproteobacteria bacterium]|nr:hypothetical protein [Deltaproteobacteria bacterium]MBN2673765.1 hypothetical protein [Deltaproteobacteria bacterium]